MKKVLIILVLLLESYFQLFAQRGDVGITSTWTYAGIDYREYMTENFYLLGGIATLKSKSVIVYPVALVGVFHGVEFSFGAIKMYNDVSNLLITHVSYNFDFDETMLSLGIEAKKSLDGSNIDFSPYLSFRYKTI